MRLTDYDDAYQNGAYIPDADRYMSMWQDRAAAFRAAHPPKPVAYGAGERQTADLFMPSGKPRGLAVFIHGGYWHKFHGTDFSHLAAGALSAGWAVGVPSYTLAPAARISEITREMARAVILLAAQVPGPLRLMGHSAGGHLVTRLGCAGVLPDTLAARLELVLSISGVHDLRPLLHTAMNAELRLSAEEAASESPVLCLPLEGLRLTTVVGANERPEFLRQTDLLGSVWYGLGSDCTTVHLPDLHHFNVIEGLTDPNSALMGLLDQSRS